MSSSTNTTNKPITCTEGDKGGADDEKPIEICVDCKMAHVSISSSIDTTNDSVACTKDGADGEEPLELYTGCKCCKMAHVSSSSSTDTTTDYKVEADDEKPIEAFVGCKCCKMAHVSSSFSTDTTTDCKGGADDEKPIEACVDCKMAHVCIASSTSTTDDSIACANCGKGEADDAKPLEICADCKMVRYCSRECQLAHRSQHKQACEKRAGELYDEALFQDPPDPEECPICMLPMPFEMNNILTQLCCWQRICLGCAHAQAIEDYKRGKMSRNGITCPFCRTPPPFSDADSMTRIQKGMKENKVYAIVNYATDYAEGANGLPKDLSKARELYLKAGDLGHAVAYYNLAALYYHDEVEEKKDTKKSIYYCELAATRGCIIARHVLGVNEWDAGNHKRACKHLMIGARAGDDDCLKMVKEGYKRGFVTKDKYAEALRSYQKQHDDRKSAMRDEASFIKQMWDELIS